MQYLSDIPLQITNTARLAVTGRSIVDLGVTANVLSICPIERLHWFRKCTVSLEVKNVGDASVYDAQYFPLPGRMFFCTLYALF
jgi:hypothetical protein